MTNEKQAIYLDKQKDKWYTQITEGVERKQSKRGGDRCEGLNSSGGIPAGPKRCDAGMPCWAWPRWTQTTTEETRMRKDDWKWRNVFWRSCWQPSAPAVFLQALHLLLQAPAMAPKPSMAQSPARTVGTMRIAGSSIAGSKTTETGSTLPVLSTTSTATTAAGQKKLQNRDATSTTRRPAACADTPARTARNATDELEKKPQPLDSPSYTQAARMFTGGFLKINTKSRKTQTKRRPLSTFVEPSQKKSN